MIALGEPDELGDGPMHQPRVRRMRNGFWLHGGINHHSLLIVGIDGASLVRHRQTFLDQRRELLLAEPLAPARHRHRSNGSPWQKLNSPQKYCRVGRGSFTLSPSQNGRDTLASHHRHSVRTECAETSDASTHRTRNAERDSPAVGLPPRPAVFRLPVSGWSHRASLPEPSAIFRGRAKSRISDSASEALSSEGHDRSCRKSL